MKKMTLFILCSLLSLNSIAATNNYERVYAVDGSEYEGYISKIIPGKQLSVVSDKSIRVIPESIITKKDVIDRVPVLSLPEDCRKYFAELADSALVEKMNISTNLGRVYHGVFVIESGINLKLLSLEKDVVDLFWNKVLKITKKPHELSDKSGYYDVVILSSTAERFVGCIIEQHMKKGMITFRSVNGTKVTIRNSDILVTRIEKISQDETLSQQYPYVDIVNTKGKVFEGIIVSKQPGKNVKILLSSGEEKIIASSEIVSYEKRLNSAFKSPVEEILPKVPVDLYINDSAMPFFEIKPMSGSPTCYELSIEPDSIKTAFAVNENIAVTMNVGARTSQVRIVPVKRDDVTIVTKRARNSKKVENRDILFFDSADNDIKDRCSDLNFESNDGESIKFDVCFLESGEYVLFIKEDRIEKCIVFKIFSNGTENRKDKN